MLWLGIRAGGDDLEMGKIDELCSESIDLGSEIFAADNQGAPQLSMRGTSRDLPQLDMRRTPQGSLDKDPLFSSREKAITTLTVSDRGATATETEYRSIVLEVRDPLGHSMLFRLRNDQELRWIAYGYAKEKSVPSDSLCLLLEGKEVSPDASPDSLGLLLMDKVTDTDNIKASPIFDLIHTHTQNQVQMEAEDTNYAMGALGANDDSSRNSTTHPDLPDLPDLPDRSNRSNRSDGAEACAVLIAETMKLTDECLRLELGSRYEATQSRWDLDWERDCSSDSDSDSLEKGLCTTRMDTADEAVQTDEEEESDRSNVIGSDFKVSLSQDERLALMLEKEIDLEMKRERAQIAKDEVYALHLQKYHEQKEQEIADAEVDLKPVPLNLKLNAQATVPVPVPVPAPLCRGHLRSHPRTEARPAVLHLHGEKSYSL